MDIEMLLHEYTFKPVAYDASETRAIMGVRRGTLVLGAAIRIGEAFDGTTPTIDVGDTDTDAFIDATDITIGTPALYPGYGAAFSAANGKLYTDDDTIDLTFVHATGSTGLATVYIVYCELE